MAGMEIIDKMTRKNPDRVLQIMEGALTREYYDCLDGAKASGEAVAWIDCQEIEAKLNALMKLQRRFEIINKQKEKALRNVI